MKAPERSRCKKTYASQFKSSDTSCKSDLTGNFTPNKFDSTLCLTMTYCSKNMAHLYSADLGKMLQTSKIRPVRVIVIVDIIQMLCIYYNIVNVHVKGLSGLTALDNADNDSLISSSVLTASYLCRYMSYHRQLMIFFIYCSLLYPQKPTRGILWIFSAHHNVALVYRINELYTKYIYVF